MLVNAQPPPVGNVKPPPPVGLTCCEPLEAEPDTPGHQEYQECIDYYTANPTAPCQTTIPIDNSRYIYITMIAGVALASFVIVKAVERKNKKTPM